MMVKHYWIMYLGYPWVRFCDFQCRKKVWPLIEHSTRGTEVHGSYEGSLAHRSELGPEVDIGWVAADRLGWGSGRAYDQNDNLLGYPFSFDPTTQLFL